MMKSLTYVTFILFIANIFFTITKYEEHHRPVAMTHTALEPVLHIYNSQLYLQEKDYDRSKNELNAAIQKINQLQNYSLNTESAQLLHRTIPELEQLKDTALSIARANKKYIKTLLTLSHIQLQYALHCCSQKEKNELIISVNRAMYIVKKALILSKGSEREFEAEIYSGIYQIAQRKIHDYDEIQRVLTETLEKIKKMSV